jgi:hypothetical protein
MTTLRISTLAPGSCVFAVLALLGSQVLAQASGSQAVPPEARSYPIGEGHNVRSIGHEPLAGRPAYKPIVQRQMIGNEEAWIAYVGHHNGEAVNPLTGRVETNGTSIVDVTDPRAPSLLHHIPPIEGTNGAQMVRTCSGDDLPGGAAGHTYLLRAGASYHQVFDVTDPTDPQSLGIVSEGLTDTHKSWWECETGIAYLVSGVPGWRTERMTQVYDLSTPASPRFIKNFGLADQLPGATGEPSVGLHGCIPVIERNRVYCGHMAAVDSRGVIAILDRDKLLNDTWADPATPTRAEVESVIVTQMRMPDFLGAHSTLPILGMTLPEFEKDAAGLVRDFLLVVNEQNTVACTRMARQMSFLVDITDERHPWPVSTYNVPEGTHDFCSYGGRFGAHASHENMTPIFHGKLVFISWFNAGVRVVDIRDPFNPVEAGYYIPAVNDNTTERCAEVDGQEVCGVATQTNNVEVDDRGYIYIADRANSGLEILDLTGSARRIAEYPDD